MMSPLLCKRSGEETDSQATSGPTRSRAATLQVGTRACGRQLIRLAVAVLLWGGPAVACCYSWHEPLAVPMNCPVPPPSEASSTPAVVLSPQQALTTYEARALQQLTTLATYSDKTISRPRYQR
jgi:hypothetical protein